MPPDTPDPITLPSWPPASSGVGHLDHPRKQRPHCPTRGWTILAPWRRRRWLEMRLWREIVYGGGRSPFKSGAGGGEVSFFIRCRRPPLGRLPHFLHGPSPLLVPRACFATSHPRSHFFKATKTQSPRGFAPSECIGTKLKKA